MEDSPAVLTEVLDSIAVVRLDRPAQRNSLSLSTLEELKSTLSALLPRADLKALILTGTGDVFASGADLAELAELTPNSALQFTKFGQRLFQDIADAKQVTIAAINGYCFGGALDLALSCDIRVASRNALFSHPGAKRGIITGWGGTQRLPRIIGKSYALDLFATARHMRSDEAFKIGLVTGVFDPVVDYALELARAMQEKPEAPVSGSF